MTGESDPVKKDSNQPFLLSGCKVEDGQGTMLVTGVGTHTEWGQVMAAISHDNGEETPLQVRLNGVATFIGKVGLSVAILVFIIQFIRCVSLSHSVCDAKAKLSKCSQPSLGPVGLATLGVQGWVRVSFLYFFLIFSCDHAEDLIVMQ
jgi:magnesium-transporting ATPase (P-type)